MVTFSTSFKSFQTLLREFIAECLGTFLLVFSGNNAVAETMLTDGTAGNSITIYFGYGFGLFLGILVSGSVSGGHLNPAVTVAGAILKRFKWTKVFHYVLAQYLGAFIGACATYVVYIDSFESYHLENGLNKTAGIFSTYPKDGLTVFGSFADQILGSMILLLGIYAVTDPFNNVPGYLAPIYVALTLVSIACSLGVNQGFAINPARDFSPRFFTYITCWGAEVFGSGSYWYVTLIAPHIGALLGASIYVFGVEKLRSVKDLTNSSPVATVDAPSSKNNFCVTKCAFIDLGGADRERKLKHETRKKLPKGSEKNESFSHL